MIVKTTNNNCLCKIVCTSVLLQCDLHNTLYMTFQSSVAVEYILHVRILRHVVIFMNADGNKNMSSTILTFFILLKPLYNLQKLFDNITIF